MFQFYLGCVFKQCSSVLSFSLLYPVAIYTECTAINHLKENELHVDSVVTQTAGHTVTFTIV